jgi:hypothetical protein
MDVSHHEVRSEVEEARNEVPKLPAVAARLEAEQARPERELDATKKKLGRRRVNQSVTDYELRELRKETAAAKAAVKAAGSIKLELETSEEHEARAQDRLPHARH